MFVSGRDSAAVVVIDTDTDTVIGRLEVGLVPRRMLVSESLATLVAADGRGRQVMLVDLVTRTIRALKLPFAPDRLYTPGQASLESLRALLDRLGLQRVVIVQPSPYGTDNACTLDALDRLEGRGRGVVVIDERTSDNDLAAMHRRGVRGIRVNLETAGAHASFK